MPSPQVVKPQRGRDWTSVLLSGLAESPSGLLSVQTTYTLLTTPPSLYNALRTLGWAGEVERQEINAANTTQRNEVVLSDGQTLDLEAFKVNNTTPNNQLILAWLQFDYMMAQWAEGTVTGSIATWTVYGVRGEARTGLSGRGEQIASLSLGPCDVGAPNLPQTSVTFS